MPKWAKYTKKYNPEWEKEPIFKNWLQRTPTALLDKGLPEAFCKLCSCTLRPQRNDLVDHTKAQKHRRNESALPTNRRSTLLGHGFKAKTQESKVRDLRLAVHVACHSSVKTMDHLGEVLREVTKGKLDDLRMHRTKCSKLICNVVAPCLLQDLLADVGDGWFSIIVDECTDNATVKHLGLMIKYYSKKTKTMIVDFLGIVEAAEATAQALYLSFKGFFANIDLKLGRLLSLGTDGAANLCGAHNSLFALLKKNDCPHLHLIKCICHGLDKCANKASSAFPPTLEFLVRESRNWFSHSALRKLIYEKEYKALTDGKKPPNLVKLAATRWLSWYGAVKSHSLQYHELAALFQKTASADKNERCPMAHQLAELHADKSNLLYLTFLRPFLRDLASLNVAFQSSQADISVAYRDLRAFVFTTAKAVVKPEALKQSHSGGMLRLTELQALQAALQRPENFKPVELVNYGEGFWKIAAEVKLPDAQMKAVQRCCADFLVKFTHELVNRLPSCIEAVQGMRAFSPKVALTTRGRPEFRQLPLNMLSDSSIDMEAMAIQWNKLSSMQLEDICPGEESVEAVDIVTFWSNVWDLKSGAGQLLFPDLGKYVISALTLPLSNAVVERLFSILGIVKHKLRNKLGMEMLSSILRIRTHLHAHGMCCTKFDPSDAMVANFNSKVLYQTQKSSDAAVASTSTTGEEREWDVDDPPSYEVPAAPGGDIDEPGHQPAEWDEMLNLLAELDTLTDA